VSAVLLAPITVAEATTGVYVTPAGNAVPIRMSNAYASSLAAGFPGITKGNQD